MEYLREETEGNYPAKWAYGICLSIILIVGTSYLGITYYRPFHIAVEAFSSFIAFSILMVAINTYEISKNIPFLFLGVAFGSAGVFNVIHIISSNGVGFFQGDTTNLAMTLSTIHRSIISVSTLICFRLYYKSYKFITPFFIILSFSIISGLLLASIFLWGNFPIHYDSSHGITTFKMLGEYTISVISIISAFIFFKKRKYIGKNTYVLLQFYFLTSVMGNILLTIYVSQQGISNVLAHILKVISFYCIYRSIVKVGIKTPYKMLFNELSFKSNSLELKESELKQVIQELRKESELRKNIEELFLKNEAAYKLLIENSKDTIIICSEGKIVFANESAARIIEADRPEVLIGKIAADFFKLNTQFTDTNFYETEAVSINGKTTPVEASQVYIIYHNKPAILSLIRDISTSKQVEKMKLDVEKNKKLLDDSLEFNRLITEFFSNISHELRTPLNVILSSLQVLAIDKYNNISEKRERYIKIMKQNCYRLLRLINNLVDITRIDSGHIKPNFQNHNIVSVVENISLSVADYIESKGISLVFDTEIEEKELACDADKIERIMLNLISNAVKFTDKGGTINISVFDKTDTIEISVKDTGVGIPENKVGIIFERFRQVDSSLSRNHEGSGIGLSIVKELIEMHNGTIRLESKKGEGSEFIISLPVRRINSIETVGDRGIYLDNSERVIMEFSDIYEL